MKIEEMLNMLETVWGLFGWALISIIINPSNIFISLFGWVIGVLILENFKKRLI